MRELFFGTAELTGAQGRPISCRTSILVRTTPPPVCCESYGVRVQIDETGEREEVLDLTVRPERIEELAALLVRGGVTPCALRDVVADWL